MLYITKGEHKNIAEDLLTEQSDQFVDLVKCRVLYNGHKKEHSFKFQLVATPNGMIVNVYGPVEGRRHNSNMLARSGLLQDLQRYAFNRQGEPLCLY